MRFLNFFSGKLTISNQHRDWLCFAIDEIEVYPKQILLRRKEFVENVVIILEKRSLKPKKEKCWGKVPGQNAFGGKTMSQVAWLKWFAKFESGHESVEDENDQAVQWHLLQDRMWTESVKPLKIIMIEDKLTVMWPQRQTFPLDFTFWGRQSGGDLVRPSSYHASPVWNKSKKE